MYPKRFAESLCLKCHHDVTELEPSERFPDPPAPKLMEGFRLIQDFGCYGCHEINGFDGPNRAHRSRSAHRAELRGRGPGAVGRRRPERTATSTGPAS